MVMGELSVLLENKKELVDHLNDILVEPLFQKLQDIYDDTQKNLTIRDSSSILLKRFQDKITLIPEWTKQMKRAMYDEIVEKSSVTYIGDLIQGILVTQIKIIIKTENPDLDVPKLKFRVPSAENFIHMSLVVICRNIWKQTYLMYHNVRNLEKQHNIAQIEDIIRKSISSTIRSCLPLDELFKYIKSNSPNNDDDNSEEEDTEDVEEEDDAEDDDDEEEGADEEDDEGTDEGEDDEDADDEDDEDDDDEEDEEDDEDDEEDDEEDEEDEEDDEEDEEDADEENIEKISEDIVFENYVPIPINKDRKVNADTEFSDKLVITLTNNISENTENICNQDDEKEPSIVEAFEVVKVSSNNNEKGDTYDAEVESVEPISPTQSVEELEKELEEALETIKTTVIEEEPSPPLYVSPSLPKPRQLPLRIVPLNIRNEIMRQSKNIPKTPSKKTDAFF